MTNLIKDASEQVRELVMKALGDCVAEEIFPAEAIPAFITIILMPLAYSISDGILLGVISYVAFNLLSGKYKKLTAGMYVLAALFILKYIFV